MPGPTPTRKSALSNVLAGVVADTVIVALFSEALAARRPAPPPAAQPSFSDELASYDTMRWIKADRLDQRVTVRQHTTTASAGGSARSSGMSTATSFTRSWATRSTRCRPRTNRCRKS